MTFKLSTRTKNAMYYALDPPCFEENSPDYAALIAGLSKQELMRIPALGQVGVAEIELWLANFGLFMVDSRQRHLQEKKANLEIRERAELARLKAKYEPEIMK